MKKLLITLVIVFTQCLDADDVIEKYKEEIMAAEVAFAKMVETDGLKAAFTHFAADDAVLMRSNEIYKGKNAIAKQVGKSKIDFNFFTWYPDFIDVSSSGDLGYTYGKYKYEYVDKYKKIQTGKGIFHTVWKRQANGQWLYVWD